MQQAQAGSDRLSAWLQKSKMQRKNFALCCQILSPQTPRASWWPQPRSPVLWETLSPPTSCWTSLGSQGTAFLPAKFPLPNSISQSSYCSSWVAIPPSCSKMCTSKPSKMQFQTASTSRLLYIGFVSKYRYLIVSFLPSFLSVPI